MGSSSPKHWYTNTLPMILSTLRHWVAPTHAMVTRARTRTPATIRLNVREIKDTWMWISTNKGLKLNDNYFLDVQPEKMNTLVKYPKIVALAQKVWALIQSPTIYSSTKASSITPMTSRHGIKIMMFKIMSADHYSFPKRKLVCHCCWWIICPTFTNDGDKDKSW